MGNTIVYDCEPYKYPFFSLQAALQCESSGGFPPVHFLWPFSLYIYFQNIWIALFIPAAWEGIEAIARSITPDTLTMDAVFPGYENAAGGIIFDWMIQAWWGIALGYMYVWVTRMPCEPLGWSIHLLWFALISIATTGLQALIMSFFNSCGACHWISSGLLAILFTLSFYAYLKIVCTHPKVKPYMEHNHYPIWLMILVYGLVHVVVLGGGTLMLGQFDWMAMFVAQSIATAGMLTLCVLRLCCKVNTL